MQRKKLSLKEFLKTLKWIFKIYFEISPVRMVLFLLVTILQDLRGLVYSLIIAKTMDRLIYVAGTEEKDLMLLVSYFGVMTLHYIFAGTLLPVLYSYSKNGLEILSRSRLDMMLAQQLNKIGIQTLENPTVQNQVQRANMWVYETFVVLQETVKFVSNLVRVVVTGLVIFSFMPFMVPILMTVAVVRFIPISHYMKKSFRWQVDNTERRRNAKWNMSWLMNPVMLQEINIVGAFKYLSEKFDSFFTWFNSGFLKILKERLIVTSLLDFVDILFEIAGYIVICHNYIVGKITLGTVSFQMRALSTFTDALGSLLSSVSYMNEYALKMEDVIAVFEMKPTIKDGDIKLPDLDTPPNIEFKNVYFRYPRAKKFVFKNLSFKIESGEEVALVGHNGAGKTTIVRLLCRIYEVTKGEILINGINIKDLSINDWYKNIGVLFQEFNLYKNLTVRENIILGKPLDVVDEEEVIEAAKHADAHDFIMEYKKGYDQIMSEKFRGGIRPSSGQMQKIAIARFFYRNSPLVIFDEPTASIDAVSEYKIFNDIYSFFSGKTVVIISHRFSTVRNADKIIVLEKGKIVEQGSHEELIKKKDGTYSKAYKLQAEGYQ